MFNVLASFDEYELDIRRECRAETKARVMKERGVHLGRTPLGYLRASKQPKHACDITLERAAELLRALGSGREPVSAGLMPDPGRRPRGGATASSRNTAAKRRSRSSGRPCPLGFPCTERAHDLAGTRVQATLRARAIAKAAAGLDDDVHAELRPGRRAGIALAEEA
jgi:hypothetical protein